MRYNVYLAYVQDIYMQQWLLYLVVEHRIDSHFMSSRLFHFHFNLWLDSEMLMGC